MIDRDRHGAESQSPEPVAEHENALLDIVERQVRLDGTLAATPERVYEMFDRLWEPTLKLAGEELAEMKAIKAAETGDSTFASWDWWYYADRSAA